MARHDISDTKGTKKDLPSLWINNISLVGEKETKIQVFSCKLNSSSTSPSSRSTSVSTRRDSWELIGILLMVAINFMSAAVS